jgi:hypothetical protein
MFERSKIILGFAFLGFFAGVTAYIAYKEVGPVLARTFPFLVSAEWFLSGLIGTFFTVVLLVLWAMLTKPQEP